MENGDILEIVTHNTEQYLDGQRPISTSLNIESSNLVFRLKERYPELQNIAEITRGVHPYRTGGYGKTAFFADPEADEGGEETQDPNMVFEFLQFIDDRIKEFALSKDIDSEKLREIMDL
jgi:hypothetical protein